MLFGYPNGATDENWLHECIVEMLQAIHGAPQQRLVGQLACRMPFLDQVLFGSNWAMSAGS